MTTRQEAIKVLRNPRHWPMDKMAELFDEVGLNDPRPRDVLRVFFDAMEMQK